MTADDAVTVVLVEARRYLGVTEHPPGSNRGVEVDYWIREAGLKPEGGFPWCAAFVDQVGRQALGTLWPCPRTASVLSLVQWAEATAGVWMAAPTAGDLFVLWEADLKPARYGHVGFVERLSEGKLFTIEGNTNPGGGREGFGVFARQRAIQATTHYLRWTAALKEAG